MKKFKKLTAGLLGAVMALSVCSFTALAADRDVAKIGDTGYPSVSAALEQAPDKTETTIELIADTTEDITIGENKNIVLDLGDHTIKNSSKSNTITNNGTLRIKGDGTVDNTTHGTAALWNNGIVVLDGGNYTRSKENGSSAENSGGNSYYTLLNHGTMTINDGVRVSQGPDGKGQFSSLVENGWYDGTKKDIEEIPVMIINGGVFSGGLNTIKNDDWGKLVINGGTFKNTTQAAFLNWNVAEVNGGKFESEGAAILVGSLDEVMDKGELTINGGTFESEKESIAQMTDKKGEIKCKNTVIKINGGTFKSEVEEVFDEKLKGQEEKGNLSLNIVSGRFSSDVSEYMAEGSKLVEYKDGNFVIMTEKEYEDYLDSKRPSHSYSLEEGRVERDDEDEEEPVVTTPAEEEESPYEDVGKDNPYYNAIVYVTEKGWMSGISTDSKVFAPNGTLTRGMGVMVLWNKAGCPEPQNVAPFLDVTSDAWYAKAVAWAYEQGISAGYGETFGPNDYLTTEQFTRMSDIANGKTPADYVGGAPNATRGWVATMLAL